MKCKHYMVSAPTYVLDTAPLSEAVSLMIRKHMQDLMVVNDRLEFIGTINSFMFSKMLLPPNPQLPDDAENESAEDVDNRLIPHLHRKVGDFAASHPVVEPEAPLSDALRLLSEGYIRLPVVDADRKLVGSLSSLTILRRFRF
ncbi:MAG TPA: CBS domain-containing protein [Candidatus Competibacteraceae bacterium]|nr:CBS domain-containing protein [Candidatus Competibacteraceae bacterium]MCP5132807.1 CBS domain-containing protein [Gammaproteobacteria bacterium]HPF57563.1 CBS domain-containing protein [Candidatus Competibacteraceae bacterium]HRY16916.1 CBS domain-containing protein [Candidatus Competibacteraceae bacterium]